MLTRRGMLQAGVAAGVFADSLAVRAAEMMPDGRPWPSTKIGNVHKLELSSPVEFSYPDENSPAWLLKLGSAAYDGVGPDKDIVAFSGTCTHMGCPVSFDGNHFLCPCHYSMFDPAKNGQVYQGLASDYLPQIALRIDSGGDIYAERMSGLIWGRANDEPIKG